MLVHVMVPLRYNPESIKILPNSGQDFDGVRGELIVSNELYFFLNHRNSVPQLSL